MRIGRLQRRSFITLLGGALAWPFGSSAQDSSMPVIGFLHSASPGPFAAHVDAFHRGLRDGGYVEGRNVAIEYRWAEGQAARLRELADDLVRRRVSLIAATGGTVTARAAKAATDTIPILFIGGPNPIEDGLASSLNRPGGNATGVALATSELMPKRVQLLAELVPGAATIALLVNPTDVAHEADTRHAQAAVRESGQRLIILEASEEGDFEPVFLSAIQQRADALLVSANAYFTGRRRQIVALAARHRLPVGYPLREYVDAGGLMSYGPSIPGAYRVIGRYASRILAGDKPGELPIQLPTKFELVINLTAVKSLGLSVSPSLFVVAEELVE